MKLTTTLLLTLAFAAGTPLAATASSDMAGAGAADQVKPGADAAAALADGEVKKIDKDAGKITIKHGPLANLAMPGMTMVFRVKDPAMLEQAKAGDKVKFIAEKVDGALTITVLQTAK
ncbi:Cu(I)/Ag(I) efflux system periplasmic protein CusF [Janthinobacterium sp. CG_23.3]|uniref:copper-binding protein n=1 Tax=Janthinobacterium sp. CG_23.3 TaxID=3349634 RepID=UPI0038D3D6AA